MMAAQGCWRPRFVPLLASDQKTLPLDKKVVWPSHCGTLLPITSVRGARVTRHEVEADVCVVRTTCGSFAVTAYLINLAATSAWPTRQPARNTHKGFGFQD